MAGAGATDAGFDGSRVDGGTMTAGRTGSGAGVDGAAFAFAAGREAGCLAEATVLDSLAAGVASLAVAAAATADAGISVAEAGAAAMPAADTADAAEAASAADAAEAAAATSCFGEPRPISAKPAIATTKTAPTPAIAAIGGLLCAGTTGTVDESMSSGRASVFATSGAGARVPIAPIAPVRVGSGWRDCVRVIVLGKSDAGSNSS